MEPQHLRGGTTTPCSTCQFVVMHCNGRAAMLLICFHPHAISSVVVFRCQYVPANTIHVGPVAHRVPLLHNTHMMK